MEQCKISERSFILSTFHCNKLIGQARTQSNYVLSHTFILELCFCLCDMYHCFICSLCEKVILFFIILQHFFLFLFSSMLPVIVSAPSNWPMRTMDTSDHGRPFFWINFSQTHTTSSNKTTLKKILASQRQEISEHR